MKKIIATTLLAMGMAAYVNAQGTFVIDSTANAGDGATPTSTTGGLVFIQGVLDTTTDINLQLLWGTSASQVTTALNMDPGAVNAGAYAGNTAWIASQGSGGGDITGASNGGLLDLNGNVYVIPGNAAGTLIYMALQGWTGASATYGGAVPSVANGVYAGQTGVFSVTLAASSTPTQPDIHTMGSLDLVAPVPEPGTMALAAIGGASMLLFRRRK